MNMNIRGIKIVLFAFLLFSSIFVVAAASQITVDRTPDGLAISNLPSGSKVSYFTDTDYAQDPADIIIRGPGTLKVKMPGRTVTFSIASTGSIDLAALTAQLNGASVPAPSTGVSGSSGSNPSSTPQPSPGYTAPAGTSQQATSARATNIDGLNSDLEEAKLLVDGIAFRDQRLSGVVLQTAYIDGMYVSQLLGANRIAEAQNVLQAGVKSALKHNGRLPRLYYADGNGEGTAATVGDASSFSIALGKYLAATRSSQNDQFRQNVAAANELIQSWQNTVVQQVPGKAYGYMSDSGYVYDAEGGAKLTAVWDTAISCENQLRRASSMYYAGNLQNAKRLTLEIYQDSWIPSRSVFATGIDPVTLRGTTGPAARDVLGLIINNMNSMGLINEVTLSRLTEAYLAHPDFLNEKGEFGFEADFKKGGSNAIPEFMYTDAQAGLMLARILKSKGRAADAVRVETRAKNIQKLAQQLDSRLQGGYSEEYAEAGPNSATVITRHATTYI